MKNPFRKEDSQLPNRFSGIEGYEGETIEEKMETRAYEELNFIKWVGYSERKDYRLEEIGLTILQRILEEDNLKVLPITFNPNFISTPYLNLYCPIFLPFQVFNN